MSVIVTCYNQEQWILDALESVRAQTYQDVELVVVDDGSTDGSLSLVRAWLQEHRPSATLLETPHNRGLPSRLNSALGHVRGEALVVLNGDDWMEPHRVAAQFAALESSPPAVGLVFSDFREVDEAGDILSAPDYRPNEDAPRGSALLDLVSRSSLGMPAVMVRTKHLRKAGSWDESLMADDYDLFLRLAATGCEFAYHPDVLVNYRRSPKSMTASRSTELVDGRFQALQKQFGRDPAIDQAILKRMEDLVVALHRARHDRRTVSRRIWFVMRRRPTKRLIRVAVEFLLHLDAGALVVGRK